MGGVLGESLRIYCVMVVCHRGSGSGEEERGRARHCFSHSAQAVPAWVGQRRFTLARPLPELRCLGLVMDPSCPCQGSCKLASWVLLSPVRGLADLVAAGGCFRVQQGLPSLLSGRWYPSSLWKVFRTMGQEATAEPAGSTFSGASGVKIFFIWKHFKLP